MASVTASSIEGNIVPGISVNTASPGDFDPPMAPFRERLSWALYDFANTVFSMNVATLYFAAWLVAAAHVACTL